MLQDRAFRGVMCLFVDDTDEERVLFRSFVYLGRVIAVCNDEGD